MLARKSRKLSTVELTNKKFDQNLFFFVRLSKQFLRKVHVMKFERKVTQKHGIFFNPPPPPPKPSKKGRILDFLTTRFIAEKFFSNKMCG